MASIAGIGRLAPSRSTPALQQFAPQSSFIASFEYDSANLTLTTFLKSGAIYQHKFVTPMDFEALKTSKSASKHWASQIKGKKASVSVRTVRAPLAAAKKQGRPQ